MATILTSSPFVNATAMVAGTWNTKYDLLYNELNGNLDNANTATTAGITENKLVFSSSGHDHSASNPIALNSITTVGANKGDIIYFDGNVWATLGSGANGTQLKIAYDTYTKLLSHFDGADGANTYTAETGQAFTFQGSSMLTTGTYQFGVSSLNLNGTTDYITFPDSADWNFGAGDLTIDCWVKFNSLVTNATMVSQFKDISNFWQFTFYPGYNLLLFECVSSGAQICFARTSWTPTYGQWYHVAFSRSVSNGHLYLFVDGVKKVLDYEIGPTATLPDLAADPAIGQLTTSSQLFKGWIDEMRISKGIARWTDNFVVPVSQYESELRWS